MKTALKEAAGVFLLSRLVILLVSYIGERGSLLSRELSRSTKNQAREGVFSTVLRPCLPRAPELDVCLLPHVTTKLSIAICYTIVEHIAIALSRAMKGFLISRFASRGDREIPRHFSVTLVAG